MPKGLQITGPRDAQIRPSRTAQKKMILMRCEMVSERLRSLGPAVCYQNSSRRAKRRLPLICCGPIAQQLASSKAQVKVHPIPMKS